MGKTPESAESSPAKAPSLEALREAAVLEALGSMAGIPPDPFAGAGATAKTRADAVNPRGGDYAGGRGADMLVIYLPDYGPRTTTNPWGGEAVIERGVVIALGGNDSPIPREGFVLSGHDRGKDWILQNLDLGDEVEVNGMEITRRRTVRSSLWRSAFLTSLARLKHETDSSLADARPTLEAAQQALDHALAAARDASNPAAIRVAAAEAAARAEEAYFGMRATVAPEGRGVWVHLEKGDPAEIEALVETLAAANINMIFPETVFYGRTIYPAGPEALAPQFEEFQGQDPLATLIEAAHRREIQVHAWCHIFFIGMEDSPLARAHPEWLAMDRLGRVASAREPGFRYIQPTNPEAREFQMRVFEDLVRRYPLDGFQFDYIRYPAAEKLEEGFDYSDRTRAEFQALHGRDPLEITPESDPEAWRLWCEYRENAVDSFVSECRARLRAIRPDLQFSAAVFGDVESARQLKNQNWPPWVEKGWLDFLAPMAYYPDAAQVGREVQRIRAVIGPDCPVYAGLGPFMGLSAETLVDQVEAARENGAQGVVFFASNYLNERQYRALRLGVFRAPSPAPPIPAKKK